MKQEAVTQRRNVEVINELKLKLPSLSVSLNIFFRGILFLISA